MNKIYVIVFLMLISTMKLSAQSNTGTPYSSYGIGLLPENVGPFTAMGGVSAAMRNAYNINYLNPASYTALDTNRWHFQFGMTGEYVHISTRRNSADYKVAQNASLNMAFRAYKRLFASFGFNQRSDIGYDLVYYDKVPGSQTQMYSQHMKGEGGINEFYLGVAWSYGNLSIGANAACVFGKLDRRQTLSAEIVDSYYIRTSAQDRITDFLCTFGVQYKFKLSQIANLDLGTSFNFNTNLHSEKVFQSYKVSLAGGSSTILDDEELEIGSISYPFRIISGFNYSYKDRWEVAGDYTFQQMSKYKEYAKSKDFQDYHKGAFGMSYTPERYGRYWWQRNTYSIGAYMARSHVRLKSVNVNTYGITLGSQIPIINRSRPQALLLGISLDFGIRGTERRGLVQEKYAKLRLDIAFKETWFTKRKIY